MEALVWIADMVEWFQARKRETDDDILLSVGSQQDPQEQQLLQSTLMISK